MKTVLLLTSLLLLAPVVAADAPATDADCVGTPCDEINYVCETVGGGPCLGHTARAEGADCMGPVCDQINLVCQTVFGQMCLGLTSAGAECAGYWLCDTINDVCGDCIPATATEAEGVECMGPGCEEINEVCRVAGLPDPCVQ